MTSKEQLAAISVQLENMQKQIEELHHTICGNGQPGLKIDVDRLKQRQKLRDWVLTGVLVPLALSVAGLLFNWYFNESPSVHIEGAVSAQAPLRSDR